MLQSTLTNKQQFQDGGWDCIEEGTRVTLVMCTFNNCLIVMASCYIISRLERRLASVERPNNYHLPSPRSYVSDTLQSTGVHKTLHT